LNIQSLHIYIKVSC